MEENSSGLMTVDNPELDEMLYARHAEVESFKDLEAQRGTQIPALFNQFYKFVQNPSTVSVETFKRMIDTDDTIGSGVDFLTTCLAARLGRYEHPSQEVTQWVNDSLGEIDNGWFNCVKELLSAVWAGFSVGEKVWANTERGFVIKKCVAYPPSTILFETERTGELTPDGILQYQRNYNPVVNSSYGILGGISGPSYGFAGGASRPDPYAKLGDLPFPLRTGNTFNYMSVRIPTEKCVHYSFDAQGKFGNPYGRSLLRRCYKFYVMKDAFLQMLSIALDRKGTPLTIVYCDPSATLLDTTKAGQGNAKGKTNVGIRADDAAKLAFNNIHNDSTIFLPGKKGQTFDTDFVPQDAHADQFLAALEFCNKSILRALLIPQLLFGGGDGAGSYSLGKEHTTTFDKILDGMLEGLTQTILQQVVKELIAYNFPREVWQKEGLGRFGKHNVTDEEAEKLMGIYEKAISNGAIDKTALNDVNKMRGVIQFEPVDKPIISQEDLMREAQMKTEGQTEKKKTKGDSSNGK